VAFEGFPEEGLAFLAGLAEHNERAWFEERRDVYEGCLLEPARELVVETGEELARRGIDVHAEPRVNGSIFRINRDTRFSKDKRPYKTHLDLWLWQGDGPSRRCAGFFFRLRPDALVLGAGRHHLEPEPLERYRQAVANARTGEALVAAVEQVESAGFTLGGERYKRVPAGLAAEGRRADLLRHEGLFAYEDISPPPPETHTAGLPAVCAERFARLEPLQAWVVANV
jgi:uncharacterized protein (TIGR02453 family)